jgi:hypothetical protein
LRVTGRVILRVTGRVILRMKRDSKEQQLSSEILELYSRGRLCENVQDATTQTLRRNELRLNEGEGNFTKKASYLDVKEAILGRKIVRTWS